MPLACRRAGGAAILECFASSPGGSVRQMRLGPRRLDMTPEFGHETLYTICEFRDSDHLCRALFPTSNRW